MTGKTAARILDVAEAFVQKRGYNGFSFRDVAAAVGIKSASVHHHFPTKGDLATAVAARYADVFAKRLDGLNAAGRNGRWTLVGYAALHRQALADHGRSCLFGMLASEAETVPPGVRMAVRGFFEAQRTWLTGVVARGIEDGSLGAGMAPQDAAVMLLATVEGALLLARSRDDLDWFDVAVRAAILRLTR